MRNGYLLRQVPVFFELSAIGLKHLALPISDNSVTYEISLFSDQ